LSDLGFCLYAGLVQLSHEEISRLSVDERLELIGQLWDSLEHESLPLSDAQGRELDRRLDTLDGDRAAGTTWEQLRDELARRCP
jgi:putative addiction module component (TIGR02574 family)